MNDSVDSKNNSEFNISKLYEKRFKLKETTLSSLTKTIVTLKNTDKVAIKMSLNITTFINVIEYDILVISRD